MLSVMRLNMKYFMVNINEIGTSTKLSLAVTKEFKVKMEY